ncbi:MAG: Nif3-like dinuclear metal center hexameric protein [Clostridiales Family XIII bacterium]|jgi:dinuclear metal center YbgI/SA1388 family protein|nr:Nif3-like dinuclear metal center hexameric protein [Clostridiales Family XIII bacterium]
MSIKIDHLIKEIEKIAPLTIQETWDNSGLQFSLGIDFKNSDVKNIYIALNPTEDIIKDAISKKADFILTHHPFFFQAMDKEEDIYSKELLKRLEKKITENERGLILYSAHTSFDLAKKGMNYYLAKLFYGKNIRSINKINIRKEEMLIGLIFEIDKKVSLNQFLIFIKEKLNIKTPIPFVLPYDRNPDDEFIKKIGLCAGSGAYNIDKIDGKKIDIYLTGDIKYHIALDSKIKFALPIIDITHFHSEKFFIEIMAKNLQEKLGNNIKIMKSKIEKNPIEYYS